MMLKRKIILILILLYCGMVSKTVFAQDPHFSQYFSSPLTFNPAFTGYFDGNQRFTMNIRKQWANGGDTYTTGTASYDTKIMKGSIGDNDRWGLGFHGLFDNAAGGIFKNSYISMSTAFNKGLDQDGNHTLGLGVQATLAQNSVDFSNLSFSNQFTGSGFDLSVPSGETANNRSISFFDLNAGLLYNYKTENGTQLSVGASMFHILKPKISYFSANNTSLQPRYTLHAGASFELGEKDNFFASAHFMQQAGATEFVLGAAYGLGVGTQDLILYLGAWMRTKDAIYPYLSIRTNGYQIGLSYDITSSDINRVKNFSGSTELSFIYYFKAERGKGIPCFF